MFIVEVKAEAEWESVNVTKDLELRKGFPRYSGGDKWFTVKELL